MLILHQPLPGEFERTLDAYRALERLLADGQVLAIGVSNFMPVHLSRLLKETSVVPAVNQTEVHPYFPAARGARRRRRAQHPVAGLVADRGHHLLPRVGQGPPQCPGERDHRSDRRCERQDARADHAPLAHLAGSAGHPEVRDAVPDRREVDVFGFEFTADELAVIDGLDTGVRGGPETLYITRESAGVEIPDA